ncbi:FAD dependent oxidoreductase [Dictyocaulus viviparus]|uniref:FAD dependent oxidoreductase n=1 Tax=Dictyocaulus viviparus TaxID=29172 RepID=A0A0D8XG35_DICVI|nr:FAD dependent oxidoreductase [Dictyocaulus viviparus]
MVFINGDADQTRLYGNETFIHLAELWRKFGGTSGVQLLSGHILSENLDSLIEQERAYADIVYNFHFLTKRELKSQFVLNTTEYCIVFLSKSSAIHYTAFTSEGAKYCPWLKKKLLCRGVQFVQRRIHSLDELADEGFPIVVNCAGLDGARLAGDDSKVYPIRGILLKVEAPWQKHFLMRDFITFTIPTDSWTNIEQIVYSIDAVYVGTVKEDHKDNRNITDEEIRELFNRYVELQPSFQNVKIVDHFVGIRPGRPDVRVEAETRITKNGTTYKVVHNYGHGGSGFSIGWGTALHASALVLDSSVDRYERAMSV